MCKSSKNYQKMRKHREPNLNGSGTPQLDLHGIKHNDVQREVENFVLLNNPPLSIITGMSEKMRELVKEVLEEYNCMWNIPITNYGRIEVIKNYK